MQQFVKWSTGVIKRCRNLDVLASKIFSVTMKIIVLFLVREGGEGSL